MLLAINGATTMKASLPEDIAAAAAAGFDGVEIWASKMDDYLEARSVWDLRSLLDAAQLRAVSINSIEFISFRPPEEYEGIKARCQELCERAQPLGCDLIVVVPSPTPEGVGWVEIKDESVRALRELAEIAAPYGVRLAFEFLGFSWCSVRTVSQCWDIVRETSRDNVGMVLDTCHFYGGGSKSKAIGELDAGKLMVFHINDVEERPLETIEDAHRLLPGEGVIPLGDILAELRAVKYEGPCSVELFRPEYWERDPVELATAARAATLRVLQPYFELG